jgi:putative ABC transport system permease protein
MMAGSKTLIANPAESEHMTTLTLAFRNLLRNRRRSVMTLLAIILGGVTVLLFGGFCRDIQLELETGFAQNTGHLQIQRKDYFLYGSGNPIVYGIDNYQQVIDVVNNDPELSRLVTVITPTLILGGMAGNFSAGVSRTVVGVGVVVSDQNRMREWNEYNVAYRSSPMALTGSPENAAVIGQGVARVLRLCAPLKVEDCPQPDQDPSASDGVVAPPDVMSLSTAETSETGSTAKTRNTQIEVLAANFRGAPNVAILNAIKAEKTGSKEYDDIYLGMHLSQAQRLVYGLDTPRVTAIMIQLHHTRDIPAARTRLNALLATTLKGKPLEIHDFEVLNPSYGQINGMFSAIFNFMSLLIGAIVLFTISNTMGTSVVERTMEIGTLRAIGLRRSGIRSLFIAEGFLLGVTGAVLSVVASMVFEAIVNKAGLHWYPPGAADPIPLVVRVAEEPSLIASTAVGLIVVAVLSAWFPAHRAARLGIVDALRHV